MKHFDALTLTGHLHELRKRIMLVAAVLLLAMIIGLYLAPDIIRYLKSSSSVSDMTWNVFSPWDSTKMYMTVAFLFSLAVTLPFILYQLWAFVKLGLTPGEREAAFLYIPFAALSLMAGLIFSYFVVFPMSLTFIGSMTHSLGLTETYGVSQYFSFMLSIVVPVALTFELPIIVMFLTQIELLTPQKLHKMRRYAYLVLIIVASLISPPELVSHLMVLIPMLVLYEVSIVLSGSVYRRKQQRQTETGILESRWQSGPMSGSD